MDRVLVDFGFIEIRWYGFFFAIGLLLASTQLVRAFKRRGMSEEDASSLTLWLPAGMIIGAHLVHLIFYEPRSFIDNPIRIIEIGSGLASHGGAIGVIGTLYWFCRRKKASFHRYVDASMIGAVWLFPWVRIGNFFNSEIYGRTTDVPWGVIFEMSHRAGDLPRHPTQLYEAFGCFILIGVSLWVEKRRERYRDGFAFYYLLSLYFMGRFFVEFFKEYQVLSEAMPLTMGQCLSLPLLGATGYMALKLRGAPDPNEVASVATTPARGPKKESKKSKKKKGRR
jgi:prolipoprotein diacylglyceryl transferase